MAHSPKILALSGSLRKQSLNQALVNAAATLAEEAGATVRHLRLADLTLPLYDQDLEDAQGLPAGALALKDALKESDGLLLASPEYNGSVTAALKNAIDWASRPREGETPLEAFRGKTAGLIAASPGALGGLRGLVHARAILGNIGVIVLPDQFALSKAHEAFDDQGALKDDATLSRLKPIVEGLVRATRALKAGV